MTTTAPPRPDSPAPPRPEPAERPARTVSAAAPVAAALSVVLASTAVSGVVVGLRWIGFVLVAAAVVAATGVLLRGVSLRGRALPGPLVILGQLVALTCLLTAVFTRTGLLAVVPTPTALGELRGTLGLAMEQVRSGVPPVEATTEMLLLITVGLGLVAVVVDAIAVTAAAPAAAGLVLLCVFAVPASVAETLLPWWAFAAGAAGFAALLAVDGQRRHLAWRGVATTAPADAGATPTATVVAGVALVVALGAGAAFTAVGTIGRLPGDGAGGGSGASTGIGLKPFTSLRGQLNRQGVGELFRVRGLDQRSYLRAMTLRSYDPGQGWLTSGIGGDPLGDELPLPSGQSPDGVEDVIEIEPQRYSDNWLPVYGVPLDIDGARGGYRYDSGAGIVVGDRARRPGPYTVRTLFPDPSFEQLREVSGPDDAIDPEYLQIDGIDARVRQLAEELTRDAGNRFDRVVAISNHFTAPGSGFRYDQRTAGGADDDALVDFLFNGKVGYCEQYASVMAVLLRVVGIPSRVVVGYTAGYEAGDQRVITTEDAHAWVEAYFPNVGWLTFDPTPLPDGRTSVPSYVLEANTAPTASDGLEVDEGSSTAAAPTASTTTAASGDNSDDQAGALPTGGDDGGSSGPLLLALLIVLLLAAAAGWPAFTREWQRRTRLRLVATGGPEAATAAWRELLAESWDRGSAVPATDTVRLAAHRLAREHGLDDDGRRGLRSVVSAIERSWYGARRGADPALVDGVREVRESFSRNAPLALRARLFPRSVLRPAKPAAAPDDD